MGTRTGSVLRGAGPDLAARRPRAAIPTADAAGNEGVYVAEIDLTPGRYTVEYDEGGRLVWRYFKHVFRKERMPGTYGGITKW